MAKKILRIACETGLHAHLTEMDDFQGQLKDLSTEAFNQLRGEIVDTGIAFATHVWMDPKEKRWKTVDGHQRRRVIGHLVAHEGYEIEGGKGIPIVPVKARTFKEAKRRVLQGISQYGRPTGQGLYEFMHEAGFSVDELTESFRIPDLDIASFRDEYFSEPEDLSRADESEEPPVHPKSREGDLFILGGHRLLCGDSTSAKDLNRLCDGEKPDCVFTSPPYNVGIEYATHNDKMESDEYWKMIDGVIENIYSVSSEDIWMLWNVGASVDAGFDRHMAAIRKAKFEIDRAICWKKKGITGPPIFAHTKNAAVTKYYMPFFGWEFIFTCYRNKSKGTKKLPKDVMDRRMTDVWEVDQSVNSSSQAGHPAAFPVQLASDAIALFCDHIVYEPFCGSGTTLIAAEHRKRRCFGMEKSPAYVDVILNRWAKFTGEDPVRVDPKGKTVPWSKIKPV